MTKRCGATFTFTNGSVTTPCNLEDGHAGDHDAIAFGMSFTWPPDISSEEEEHAKNAAVADVRHRANPPRGGQP